MKNLSGYLIGNLMALGLSHPNITIGSAARGHSVTYTRSSTSETAIVKLEILILLMLKHNYHVEL